MAQLTETQKKWVDNFRGLRGGEGSNQGPSTFNVSGPLPAESRGPVGNDRLAFHNGDDPGTPNAQPAPSGGGTPPVPAPKREVKIEVGKGVLKGAIVLSTERGPSGVPISESDWQVLQQKTSLKLGSDVVAKFETKLLNGETELGEIIEGLTVDLEVSGGKMDVSSKGLDVTLMTVTIKLKGDVTKWREFGPYNKSDVKFKITGQLQANLGSIPKWKDKVAKLAASHVDELLHAEKIGKLTDDIDKLNKERFKVTDEIEKLRKDEIEQGRLGKKPDTSKRVALEAKRTELDGKYNKARDELKKTTHELTKARNATDGLRGKLKGKLDKAIAKVMATKTARVIGKILLKAIPIINIISTIIDVVDIIKNLKNLFKKYEADGAAGGGDDDGEKGKGGGSEKDKGPTDGPVTNPRQVDPTLPPPGAPPKTPGGTDPKTGEPGKGDKDKGDPTGPTDGPVTSPGQVDKNRPPGPDGSGKKPESTPPPTGKTGDGPITKPSQVPAPHPLDKDPRVILMRNFPDDAAAEWFTFQGDTLVITPTAMDWITNNVGTSGGGLFIKEAEPKVVKMTGPPPGWVAQVQFEYSIDGATKKHSHRMLMAVIGDKLRIARGEVTHGEPDVDPYKKK